MSQSELLIFIDRMLTTCYFLAGGILVIAFIFFKDKK